MLEQEPEQERGEEEQEQWSLEGGSNREEDLVLGGPRKDCR